MRIERPLVLVLLMILFFLLFGSTFRAHFNIVEEHHIIRDKTPLPNVVFQDLARFGRIRPVYFFFHSAKVAVLATNPFAWHLLTTSLGVLTVFFLYLAMRGLGADAVSSFVFVLLCSVSGLQSAVWYQVYTPQETIGMLLVSLCLWAVVCAARRPAAGWRDVGFLTAAALAGLAKESFVLVIPAFLMLRLTLHRRSTGEGWRAALRRLRLPLLVGCLVFAVELTALALVAFSMPASYGPGVVGLSWSSFSPRAWLQLLGSSGLAAVARHLPLAALILAIYCWWPGRSRRRRDLIAGSLILAAWLLPQLVLYHHGMAERYVFPAIVAPAAAVSLGLAAVWRVGGWLARTAWLVQVLLLLPTLSQGVRVTTEAANRWTAETVSVHRMLHFLARTVPAARAIVIIADPGTPYGFEATYALPAYLAAAGSASRVFLWPVTSPPAVRSPAHLAAAGKAIAQFGYPEGLMADQVGGAILIDAFLPFDGLPRWFAERSWRDLTFVEPYYALVLPELRYVKAGEVSHVVLVPGVTPSQFPNDQPLISIAPALRGQVGVSPLLTIPGWGMEGKPPFIWLGEEKTGQITGLLWSEVRQRVGLIFEVAPGPSRPDPQRTVELTLPGRAPLQPDRRQFDRDTRLSFPVQLLRGYNPFSFRVLDKATILTQPNGDTRPLLVLLRSMHITPDNRGAGDPPGPMP